MIIVWGKKWKIYCRLITNLKISRLLLADYIKKIAPKSVPHVQHDYYSSFSQSNHWFVALSLAWSFLNSLKSPFAFFGTTPWSVRAILWNWTNLFLSFQGEELRHGTKQPLDLRCNVYANVGNPGPVNNNSNFFSEYPCKFRLVWESLYACPKCKGHEVDKIVGECINGTRNVTLVRSTLCWGTGGKHDNEVTSEPCPVVAYGKWTKGCVSNRKKLK